MSEQHVINLLPNPVKIKSDDKATGETYNVTALVIDKEGYIPDLTVRMDNYDYEWFVQQQEMRMDGRRYIDGLEEDDVFIAGVMEELRKLGYEGKPFGRAELGMQGNTYIVLEPSQDFRSFVVDNYGWVDLSNEERPNYREIGRAIINELKADHIVDNLSAEEIEAFARKTITKHEKLSEADTQVVIQAIWILLEEDAS